LHLGDPDEIAAGVEDEMITDFDLEMA